MSHMYGRIRMEQGERSEWRIPNRSFTLVEMLVVIAIISILAALITPSLHTALEQSRGLVCTNNMKQMYTALIAYADDNNQWVPTGDCNVSIAPHFMIALIPYYGKERRGLSSDQSISTTRTLSPNMTCPSENLSYTISHGDGPVILNFAMTRIIANDPPAGSSKWGGMEYSNNGWKKCKRLNQISENSVIVTEKFARYFNGANSDVWVHGYVPEPATYWHVVTPIYYFSNTPYVPNFYHNNACSFLFLEGNIRMLGFGVSFNSNWQLK